EPKKPRLDGDWLGMIRAPARAQLTEPLHRPDIMFVAQRAKQSFPKGLLPTGLASARLKNCCFALQSHLGCLEKQRVLLLSIEFAERRATFAAQCFGHGLRAFAAQPQAQFANLRV